MQFLYPNVLSLLVLLFILIFLISTSKDNLQRIFTKDILDKLQVSDGFLNNTIRNTLFFITLILFVVSLARPVMDEKQQNIKQKLIPIVVAVDVSKSMMATDIYPNRIELAKKKLKLLIQTATNATMGIVLFAKNSYILSPLTEDFTSLKYIVDNLDTTLNFANGSNIYAVLEATKQMLLDYKVKNLIILSDGGNDDSYTDELEFAKNHKISIYTVGLATKNGSPIPAENGYVTDNDGNIVTVSLNESIKNLALNSGGGYIDFSLANDDIEAIINQIQTQSKKEEIESKKIKTYTELFYYPLALGLILLLIALSSLPKIKVYKNRSLVLFFICFITYPQDGLSGILDFQTLEMAEENYTNKNYKEAILEYKKIKSSNEKNYNLANSYYKNKEYKKAIDSYNKIITKDKELEYKKLHNLGNSYVKEKKLQKAKEFYEKALKLKDDKQTKENLEAVKKAMEKQKQNNKQDKEQQKNKENKESKENKQKNSKQNQSKKQKKNDKKQKSKENKQNEKQKQQKVKKQDISDMEEKKWLKTLQRQKAPIMLQKVKSKKVESSNIEQPW
jgi:Ca-activated chloride channel family protein